MLKTNIDKVVKCSVLGNIRSNCRYNLVIGNEGEIKIFPGIGGITYNVKLGDCAFGWAGDHIEPGVSIHNDVKNDSDSLNILSCIGNEAVVMTGEAKWSKGIVTGKHSGAEDVMIYFEDEEILEKLCIGDKIQVKAYGQGLELENYKDIKIQSVDPNLFLNIDIKEEGGVLYVPVVAVIPPYLMGSGMGSPNPYRGDYDLMTGDKDALKEFNLDNLRFGDLVLLQDCDNVYGRGYLKGAVSVGVVMHSDSIVPGHGPGITTIMSCRKPMIKHIIDKESNVLKYI